MAGQRSPRVLGLVRKLVDDIDRGTLNLQRTPPPGPVGHRGVVNDAESIERHKQLYLEEARGVSYAMQAKAALHIGSQQSILGGKFLRMYLDGKLDPEVAEAAGAEIAVSKEYIRLSNDTTAHVQSSVHVFGRSLTEHEVAMVARQYLQRRKKSSGIAFRGPLNPVIGGITGIEVGQKARFLSRTERPDGVHVEFELDVTLSDSYDFSNKRTGEYEAYRKKLAALLLHNRFDEFDEAYWGEVAPVESLHKTRSLDNAALFASFMYALEKRGWTPGPLAWHVTIPMRGTFTVPKSKPHPTH